jgi:PAS domain S-box-containing protein
VIIDKQYPHPSPTPYADPTTIAMTTQEPTRPSAVAIASLERQLKVAQQITRIGSWEWDVGENVVTWSDELYRIYGLPVGMPMTFETFLACVHPADRDSVQRQIAEALQRGGRFAYGERIVRPDGEIRELDSVCEVAMQDGQAVRLVGTCRDVTEERERDRMLQRVQQLELGERRALEMLANGATLPHILEHIARVIEALDRDALVSIQTLDPTGTRIRHAAAPSLPAEYNRAIDGIQIGPAVGSCGTAVYRGELVIVGDIATDALWADYRELARAHDLRACWSSPLIGSEGNVIGTFATYYRRPRVPDAAALDLVKRASHVAGIVIERRQLDDRMRALTERTEGIREDERTRIAREIHDELGQALTVLKMDIAWVARRASDPKLEAKLAEMSHATDEVISSVRRISADLRPGILDDLGLEAAIEWQLEDFAKHTGVAVALESRIGDPRLDRTVATTAFRICQEALTNVARHAKATRVDVTLRIKAGQLELEIADDGVGVPERTNTIGSLGLLGMRERARRLGGECEVRRRVPTGTAVQVQLPVRIPGRA